MDLLAHIQRLEERCAELEASLGDPAVFDDRERSREVSREYSRVRKLAELGREYRKVRQDISRTEQEREALEDDEEMAQLAEEELRDLRERARGMEGELQMEMLPPDPMDSRNTIVEIRAATGGSEAALFVTDLYRMFQRYADLRRWEIG